MIKLNATVWGHCDVQSSLNENTARTKNARIRHRANREEGGHGTKWNPI